MKREQFQQWQQILAGWQFGILPGIIGIGLFVFLRLLGLLQPLEWWALDYLLRLRPPEPTDEQILIVGINEKDIQIIGSYPIPDANLATLVEKLQTYQPKVIGIDIVRDRPVTPGHDQFTQVLQQYDNVFGIEKALPDAQDTTVNPPPTLPPERVGFVDLIYDADGILRRALVGTPTQDGYKFSLPMRLTERYLASSDPALVMENGIRDKTAIRFGTTEFTRFRRNSGGYVNADARGNQFLINYRSGDQPFQIVSLTDVMQDKVPVDQIRDRLVLIGMTATSVGDLERTSAVNRSGLIYGVEVHAHIASQMINSSLHNRPWLNAYADSWEYLWIIGWGMIGVGIGRFLMTPSGVVLGASLASLALISISFLALIAGWWLIIVPALFALVFNSFLSYLSYHHQRELQVRLNEQQILIDRIYSAIHNGPVQALASILGNVRSGQFPQQFETALENLEQDLRAIEGLAHSSIAQPNQVYLCGSTPLNLQHPLDQLLYQVYDATLNRHRDFPIFAKLKFIQKEFEIKEDRCLTAQQKQGLCRFLEEALCNAGKYAEGMTCLEVSCVTVDGWNIISIVDNGSGIEAASVTKGGYGTKHASTLARQLGGKFRRLTRSPKGTICELRYPVSRPWFRIFQFR